MNQLTSGTIAPPAVATAVIPRSVAIIMDGNGRWAAQRHLPRVEGHRAGIDSVREVVEISARLDIGALGKAEEQLAIDHDSDAIPAFGHWPATFDHQIGEAGRDDMPVGFGSHKAVSRKRPS